MSHYVDADLSSIIPRADIVSTQSHCEINDENSISADPDSADLEGSEDHEEDVVSIAIQMFVGRVSKSPKAMTLNALNRFSATKEPMGQRNLPSTRGTHESQKIGMCHKFEGSRDAKDSNETIAVRIINKFADLLSGNVQEGIYALMPEMSWTDKPSCPRQRCADLGDIRLHFRLLLDYALPLVSIEIRNAVVNRLECLAKDCDNIREKFGGCRSLSLIPNEFYMPTESGDSSFPWTILNTQWLRRMTQIEQFHFIRPRSPELCRDFEVLTGYLSILKSLNVQNEGVSKLIKNCIELKRKMLPDGENMIRFWFEEEDYSDEIEAKFKTSMERIINATKPLKDTGEP
jgi:hypothetical protein